MAAAGQWRVQSEELVGASVLPAQAPALGIVDRLAAPRGFVAQLLLFERALDADALRGALEQVVALIPTLGCRAGVTEGGDYQLLVPPSLTPAAAGALLTLGSSPATLASLGHAPSPPPRRRPYADAAEGMFGPSAAPPQLPLDPSEAPRAPLFHVAHYTLSDGAAALGVRASHLIADFGTVAMALEVLAAAYAGAPPAAAPPPQPGAPVLAALAAANLPLPEGFKVFNYLPLPEDFESKAAATFGRPAPAGVVYSVPPSRLAELKTRAQRDLAAAAATQQAQQGEPPAGKGFDGSGGAAGEEGDGAGAAAWVSTHDALVAHVWTTVASLPARAAANPTPLTLGLNVRGRMDPAACGCSVEDQGRLYGNLATTLLVPEMDVARRRQAAAGGSGAAEGLNAGGEEAAGPSLGEVAREVRRSLGRSTALFPRDVAYASLIAAEPGACHRTMILPVLQIIEDVAAGKVPLLMTSTWALDHSKLAFGGQLPLAAAPSFAPGFPIVILQPAPPAAGGGMEVVIWLWGEEHEQLLELVPEL